MANDTSTLNSGFPSLESFCTEDESRLISKAKNGCKMSMTQLLQPYEKPLFRMIFLMIHHHQDAEDLTQQSIVKAIRGISGYSDQGKFESWLFQIGRNETRNYLKKRAKYQEVLQKQSNELITSVDPCFELNQKEELRLLQQSLMKLKESEREVIILRLHQGFKFREIAQITGKSINAVLGNMRRATRQLKIIMENHKMKEESFK